MLAAGRSLRPGIAPARAPYTRMARSRAALFIGELSPRQAASSQAADGPCPPGRANFGHCRALTIKA